MRNRLILLVPALTLMGCVSPREACVSQANSRLHVLSQLIAETEANLARGYGIERTSEPRVVVGTCKGRNEDGSVFFFTCTQTEAVEVNTAVALDLNAERAKLTSLRQEIARQRPAADLAVQQCIAQHPE